MFIELPQKTHTTYHRHIYALTCTSSTPQYLVWCKNTPPPSVCHKALKKNILHTCIQYKAKVSEHLTHFKSFHIISIGLRFSNITLKIFLCASWPRSDAVMQAQITFPPPCHENMQYHFYVRCGCWSSRIQCWLFANFSHTVMFSSSYFLSWCPAINTLLVQCFTYCGLITTNVGHFQWIFCKSANLLLSLQLCFWGHFD